MSNNTQSLLKFYYPSCKENECNGILKININEENFGVNYKCEKNEKHQGKNIYYKVFERFYLNEKEDKIYKCSQCFSTISTIKIYKCKKCKNIYCDKCLSLDTHILKGNINFIIIERKNKNNINKNCSKCKRNICYCFNCNEYTCIYCSSYHKNHKTKFLKVFSPSSDSINCLINQIEEKNNLYQKIFNSLDEWEKKLKKKLENLKQRFKDEINLLKKLTYNFNPFFVESVYYINFWYLKYFTKKINFNNKKLDGTYGFEEQSKYIMKLIFQPKPIIKNKIGFVDYDKKRIYDDESIIYKIDNNHYLGYDSESKKLILKNYDKESSIKFKEKIYSITSSPNKKEIYVCLAEEEKVKILDVNLEQLKFKLSKDEIIENGDGQKRTHFNKCIRISEQYLTTANNTNINIWSKIKAKNNDYKFIKIKDINVSNSISDLLLVNKEYFISCQPKYKNIIFFNINLLEKEKEISLNISEFNNSKNCLLLLNEYIAITCIKGIAFIYIKTKEFVQFIENEFDRKYICSNNGKNIYIITFFNNDKNENIFLTKFPNNDDGFYIEDKFIINDKRLYLWGSIVQFENNDGLFEQIENYESIYSKYISGYFRPSNFICINKEKERQFYFGINEKLILSDGYLTGIKPYPYNGKGHRLLLLEK